MNRLLQRMASEWERTAFSFSGLLLVVALVLWSLGFGKGGMSFVSRQVVPSSPSVLNSNAFDFLEPPLQTLDREKQSPFVFTTDIAARTPRQRVKPKPKPNPVPKPAVTEKPAALPQTTAAVTPAPKPTETTPVRVPQTPKPKVGVRVVQYINSAPSRSGTRTGFIRVVDPVSRRKKELTVNAGDMVEGLRIQRITDEALYVIDGGGRERKIAFGRYERVNVLLK